MKVPEQAAFGFENTVKLVNQEVGQISFNGNPEELYHPINYILSIGGKRLRPALVGLGCELFGGNLNQAIPAAKAIEVFHNFTLVHDDIMDNAPLRRGVKTVHEKWNNNIAILAGDAMLIKAYDFIIDAGYENPIEILKTFNQAAIEVCEGQQLDMNFENLSEVSLQDYVNMIRLKTSVLLGAALKIGAQIAKANQKDAELLYQFGVDLGIMFQLMDDYLDAFGDPEKFGKQIGGDIISHKKTFLYIKAKELGFSKELKRWYSSTNEEVEVKVKAVKQIFEDSGAKESILKEMDKYFNQAKNHLNLISVAPELKSNLLEFADYLRYRSV